jgi:hypothetical protein
MTEVTGFLLHWYFSVTAFFVALQKLEIKKSGDDFLNSTGDNCSLGVNWQFR